MLTVAKNHSVKKKTYSTQGKEAVTWCVWDGRSFGSPILAFREALEAPGSSRHNSWHHHEKKPLARNGWVDSL